MTNKKINLYVFTKTRSKFLNHNDDGNLFYLNSFNALHETRVGPDIWFGWISGRITSILFDIKD